MKSYDQLARTAFEAYRDARITRKGAERIVWSELDEHTRSAWLAVAVRIVAEMATVH